MPSKYANGIWDVDPGIVFRITTVTEQKIEIQYCHEAE